MNTKFREWLNDHAEYVEDENWVKLIMAAKDPDIFSTLISVIRNDSSVITDPDVCAAVLENDESIVAPDWKFDIAVNSELSRDSSLRDATLSLVSFSCPVKTFSPLFFANCQIKDIFIPHGTIKLESRCFAYSSIDELSLPSSLEDIAYNAFVHAKIGRILYRGTVEQFKKLPTYLRNKSSSFQVSSSQPPITVVCSDGSFTLDSQPITHP